MAVLVVSVKERDLYLKLRNDVKAPFFLAIPLPGCYDKKKMHSKVLADRVRELKETQEGVDFMCREMDAIYNEGEKRGRAQGVAEGELKKAKEMVLSLADMGLTAERIAEAAKVSVNLVQEWLSGSRSLAK